MEEDDHDCDNDNESENNAESNESENGDSDDTNDAGDSDEGQDIKEIMVNAARKWINQHAIWRNYKGDSKLQCTLVFICLLLVIGCLSGFCGDTDGYLYVPIKINKFILLFF